MTGPWKTKKGLWGTVKRSAFLPLRYGLSPAKTRRQLQLMISSLHRLEVTPTINLTAYNLDSCPDIVRDLDGVDVGIHGYRHLPYSNLSPKDQACDLDRAIAAFRRHGLPTKGFRGPYLKTNDVTRKVLESRGFTYDSSIPRMSFGMGGALTSRLAVLARTRYGEVDSSPSFPTKVGGLVEIPVSLPDDELIVDGMGVRKVSTMKRILGLMLERTMATSSLLVLQIHPERYSYCAEAINSVVKSAAAAGAWRPSLTEIAEWMVRRSDGSSSWFNGYPFALVVTGDLDALSLPDFVHRTTGGTR